MRAFAAVVLGIVSTCRHAPPETQTRMPDCRCGSMNCCEDSKDQWDDDSGTDRAMAATRAWLLPDDGGIGVDAVADKAPVSVDPTNAALDRPASDAAAEPKPQPAADPCLECCARDPLCTCICPDVKNRIPWRPPGRMKR